MGSVEVSPQFKSTSLCVPSPTASHIAHLTGGRLQVRDLTILETRRSIALPDLRNSCIAWSPPSSFPSSAQASPTSTPPSRRGLPPRSHRFLVTDDDATRVFDLRDDKWNAVITNGSGGMGKNVHVEFGWDEDEVLVWSGFASRLVVWCLRTGRTVEIRDPKFEGRAGRGWGFRPDGGGEDTQAGRGGVMAMLCRTSGQDVLMLLAPSAYSLVKKVELPTVDAQGLKWSRDGRWLAIWDSAAYGYSLCIYTADGHLYRTITREPSDELNEWGVEGLGIKTVEWIPGNKWLAVGGWDRRVRILSTRTFAPGVFLDHTATICVPRAPVYAERVDSTGNRAYAIEKQPFTPPKAALEKNETGLMKQGIGIMAFNRNGTLCATRDDSTPTTVWIWDLTSLKPRTILTQHAPVKSLAWHPTSPSHLLIQTTHDSPTLYLYTTVAALDTSAAKGSMAAMSTDSTSCPPAPTILDLATNLHRPAGSLPAKWTARWLSTAQNKKPALVLSHQQAYILVWPEGKDQILRFEDPGGDESDDSLYDILTGRTPVPPLHGRDSRGSEGSGVMEEGMEYDGEGTMGYEDSMGSAGLEDTFRERRRADAAGNGNCEVERGRGRSVLDESGLDEMF